MTGKYYILHQGRRLYHDTRAGITDLARRVADHTGKPVTVKMHANPARGPGRTPKSGNDRKATAARDFHSGYAVGRGGIGAGGIEDEEAWTRGKAKGMARNPAKPPTPAKARKKSLNKKGFLVEYMSGSGLKRERKANKGLATVYANELKRSGYTRVRVYQAP